MVVVVVVCPPAASDHKYGCRTSLRLVGQRLESGCELHVHHAFRPKGDARAPDFLPTQCFNLWCRAGKEFNSRSSGILSITGFHHAVDPDCQGWRDGPGLRISWPSSATQLLLRTHYLLPRYLSLAGSHPITFVTAGLPDWQLVTSLVIVHV